jgi:hypothetical protein
MQELVLSEDHYVLGRVSANGLCDGVNWEEAMVENLYQELLGALTSRQLDSCHQVLRNFQASGGHQADAYSVLETVRSCPDAVEDDVLDLMDIAADWCSADSQIWRDKRGN